MGMSHVDEQTDASELDLCGDLGVLGFFLSFFFPFPLLDLLCGSGRLDVDDGLDGTTLETDGVDGLEQGVGVCSLSRDEEVVDLLGGQGTLQQLAVEVVLRWQENVSHGRWSKPPTPPPRPGLTFSIFSHDSPVLAKISAHFLFLPL